jgi:hypothetical protein
MKLRINTRMKERVTFSLRLLYVRIILVSSCAIAYHTIVRKNSKQNEREKEIRCNVRAFS